MESLQINSSILFKKVDAKVISSISSFSLYSYSSFGKELELYNVKIISAIEELKDAIIRSVFDMLIMLIIFKRTILQKEINKNGSSFVKCLIKNV